MSQEIFPMLLGIKHYPMDTTEKHSFNPLMPGGNKKVTQT